MSFAFFLKVDEKEFPLLAFEYTLDQDYQPTGPTSGVVGGIIKMLLEIPDDDLFFTGWAFSWKTTKDGSITVNRIDQASKYKEIKFKKAYMLSMSESFTADFDHLPMTERTEGDVYRFHRWTSEIQRRMNRSYVLACSIVAESVNIDGIIHDNKW